MDVSGHTPLTSSHSRKYHIGENLIHVKFNNDSVFQPEFLIER